MKSLIAMLTTVLCMSVYAVDNYVVGSVGLGTYEWHDLGADIRETITGFEYFGFLDNGIYIGASLSSADLEGDICLFGLCRDFKSTESGYALSAGYEVNLVTPYISVSSTDVWLDVLDIDVGPPIEKDETQMDFSIGMWVDSFTGYDKLKMKLSLDGIKEGEGPPRSLSAFAVVNARRNFLVGGSFTLLIEEDNKGWKGGLMLGYKF